MGLTLSASNSTRQPTRQQDQNYEPAWSRTVGHARIVFAAIPAIVTGINSEIICGARLSAFATKPTGQADRRQGAPAKTPVRKQPFSFHECHGVVARWSHGCPPHVGARRGEVVTVRASRDIATHHCCYRMPLSQCCYNTADAKTPRGFGDAAH